MSLPILTIAIQYEHDVVVARQRARQLAALLGFDAQEQTRIATAVSEIARNAFRYAGRGKVEFLVEGKTSPQVLAARISDQGPGISNLDAILNGQYRSATGMGMGIIGAKRLMDQLQIDSVPGRGTTVWLRKLFRTGSPVVEAHALERMAHELAHQRPEDPFQELQRQNQELIQTLGELRLRQEELTQLNRELEDTNRGVVALYAELDEKADHLRRADKLKTKFLSNMSHEFRTPLNSILALSRILLDRMDGDLSREQEKQILFIRKAAESLSDLVNDLLDLAKIEAGKVVIHPAEFAVKDLFSALRGMLRPLLLNESIRLVFDEPDGIPPLYTDEGKISRILRNFISNALKFTERGEVRVSAALTPEGDAVKFSVADTGIGIAAEHQECIFQEFTQIDHPVQRRLKGTGLGRPLSRKLAELLGGHLSLQSELGIGSTFSATIPLVYHEPAPVQKEVTVIRRPDLWGVPVLAIEDEPGDLLTYERYLKDSPFQVFPARTLGEARGMLMLKKVLPQAIILDILLKGEETWTFLAELKSSAATKQIPLLVASAVEDRQKGFALGADVCCVKPVERRWLLEQLMLLTRPKAEKILIVDDEVVSRYVLEGLLAKTPYLILEATDGWEGLRRAREERPSLILVDMMMPGMSGKELLDCLHADPITKDIPVIVVTAKVLDAQERERLSVRAAAVLSKADVTKEILCSSIERALVHRRPVRH